MSNNDKTILVTGATGQQGGSVVRHLLKDGWKVRAFVRDTSKPAAQELVGLGAELAQGDLDDRASLDRALAGVYGVFSFPNMMMGLEKEIEQGKAVADAAKAAGVQHFVQSSVGGVERDSGVPHFESKWQIENYVRELGLPATFLRPVYFMENFNWKRAQILEGTYESLGMNPDRPLQLISVNDIGRFAAIVFADPAQYIGQGWEIAGDELTEPQIAEVFSRVLSQSVNLAPLSAPHAFEDMSVMVEWFDTDGYEADIPALRAVHPDLQTLEDWIKVTAWVANPV